MALLNPKAKPVPHPSPRTQHQAVRLLHTQTQAVEPKPIQAGLRLTQAQPGTFVFPKKQSYGCWKLPCSCCGHWFHYHSPSRLHNLPPSHQPQVQAASTVCLPERVIAATSYAASPSNFQCLAPLHYKSSNLPSSHQPQVQAASEYFMSMKPYNKNNLHLEKEHRKW